MHASRWQAQFDLAQLTAAQLGEPHLYFAYNGYVYATTGQHLSNGGMGAVYELTRRYQGEGPVEQLVGKTFHANYLHQLRTDELAYRDHLANIKALTRICGLKHPNLLPTLIASPIADNFLHVTPRMQTTLLHAVTQHQLSPRRRVALLLQTLQGLEVLHAQRILHRDFTLRNLLVDPSLSVAMLFDFDLAVGLDDLGPVSYAEYYQGRVFGSPGWSVAPESLDEQLGHHRLGPALDVYAVGCALHGLFASETVHGKASDLWSLLVRVSDGVVIDGESRIAYEPGVPQVLRPTIEACLERDPARRLTSIAEVRRRLEACLPQLDDAPQPTRAATQEIEIPADYDHGQIIESALAADPSLTFEAMELTEHAIWAWGYQVARSLGRVRNHPIFLAQPRQDLVEAGHFAGNLFPKLVTAIDLRTLPEPASFVANWQERFWPVLHRLRQGLMTPLHRVVYDPPSSMLLLFSEYIDEPRFGDDISRAIDNGDMPLDALAALAWLLASQIALLHGQGIAHNNITPGAILLRQSPRTHVLQAAMLGLVEPALGEPAMQQDCRAFAELCYRWLTPAVMATAPATATASWQRARRQLSEWAYGNAPPHISELVALFGDGMARLDFNFHVLRDAGGDIQDYLLLVLSQRMTHRLWR